MRNVTIVVLLVLGHAVLAGETGSLPVDDSSDGGFFQARVAPVPLDEQVWDFDLEANSRRATHILVVDASGRILDIWKGNARLGDIVPLDKLLSPGMPKLTDTREARHAWLSDMSHYWLGLPFRRDRMILFLVKDLTLNPSVWHPEQEQFGWPSPIRNFGARAINPVADIAATVLQRFDALRHDCPDLPIDAGWRGNCPIQQTPHAWSACSMAYVDDLGRVRAPGRGPVINGAVFCRYSGGPRLTVPVWKAIGLEADVERKVWNALNQLGPLPL